MIAASIANMLGGIYGENADACDRVVEYSRYRDQLCLSPRPDSFHISDLLDPHHRATNRSLRHKISGVDSTVSAKHIARTSVRAAGNVDLSCPEAMGIAVTVAWGIAFLLAATYGLFDEWHRLAVRSRFATATDVLLNAAAELSSESIYN